MIGPMKVCRERSLNSMPHLRLLRYDSHSPGKLRFDARDSRRSRARARRYAIRGGLLVAALVVSSYGTARTGGAFFALFTAEAFDAAFIPSTRALLSSLVGSAEQVSEGVAPARCCPTAPAHCCPTRTPPLYPLSACRARR